MEEMDRVLLTAEECLARVQEERPELVWLKGIYDRFRKKYRLSGKQEADALIFEKMYSNVPEKTTDTLKIRYWRTGHHVPSNRKDCMAFGKALDMTSEEMDFLIKGYFDRSDRVFEEETDENPEYQQRRKLMEDLLSEYLLKIHPEHLLQMKVSRTMLESNVRHLYYTDALKYVGVLSQRDPLSMKRHITSINYGSELSRTFRLQGEIPRKTMIRHLIILGAPFISRKIMDERLEAFGYLPLNEEHTLVSGEPLDMLLIRILELYESCCRGKDPEECCSWLGSVCRQLDQYFEEHGNSSLRST